MEVVQEEDRWKRAGRTAKGGLVMEVGWRNEVGEMMEDGGVADGSDGDIGWVVFLQDFSTGDCHGQVALDKTPCWGLAGV